MEKYIIINNGSELEFDEKALSFFKDKHPNALIFNKKTGLIVNGSNVGEKRTDNTKKVKDDTQGGKYIYNKKTNEWDVNPNYNWLKKQGIKYVELVEYKY